MTMLVGTRRSLLNARQTNWWLFDGLSLEHTVAVYQPKGAADLASSYVNLARPGTFNAAPGVAPTFAAATGWTFDGTQYLTTGILGITSSYTVLVRYSGHIPSAAAFTYMLGTQDTPVPPRHALRLLTSTINYLQASTVTGTTAASAGVFGMAGTQGYYNGAADGAALSATGTTVTNDLWIGTINNLGSSFQPIKANVLALAVYNVTLTAAQVATVTNAMNVL